MDPIETWHDAPQFEAMEKEIATLTRKLAEARAEIARLLKIVIEPDVVKEHDEYLKTLFVEAKP